MFGNDLVDAESLKIISNQICCGDNFNYELILKMIEKHIFVPTKENLYFLII